MALSVGQQARYWGIGFVAFLVILYFFGSILTPYLAGAGLAYLLDPVADWLERKGASRLAATIIITVFALVSFLVVMILVVPILVEQIQNLVGSAPAMIESLRAWLVERFPELFRADGPMRNALIMVQERIQESGLSLLNSLLASSLAVFDFVLLVVISPIVAFYLLLDWDRIIARIDSWLPLDHRETIRTISSDIDKTLAGFLRGQITVMSILGVFYALGMALVGLNFGIVVGLFAGVISFVPYVGAALGGGIALALALFQFWGEWGWIAAVAGVFMVGQFLEGNVLTPNLVGSSVGLHPVWLMFALSAFGLMLGFVGLLIAVPAAAVIGVLARFALGQYLDGRLYTGQTGKTEDE